MEMKICDIFFDNISKEEAAANPSAKSSGEETDVWLNIAENSSERILDADF